ncbi:MAG TPA: response regulator, partial [Planctomycetaceae bacterium]|nr:response regulator [Planctomycetaceae bacterium]
AHNSAQELLTLLNTILDHASLASETLTLIEQPFRLYELLQKTMAPYVERTTRKGLRWTLEISPDVPDRFVGDAVRLKQVIDHLLDNAVKFTERGAIEIQVTLDQQNSGEETKLSITVGDTGPGFSTEEVHRLFEGFTQADASFARRHRGAGLGLAICTALINRLGGEFAIESQLGVGTRSQFTIPLKRQEYHSESCGDGASIRECSCQDEESATSDFRRLTILLAEDTPANQKLIQSILVKRGHRVMLASNGQEALEHFSKHDFDLIIMDLQMPKLDGYQATEAIRKRETDTQRHMPIIALTAHSGASDRKACLDAGMDAYLSKPINVAELIRVTESLANRAQFASAESVKAAAADEGVFQLDRDSIMKRLGGDEELFSSFIEVFLEDAPQLIEQVRSGIAEHDSNLVQRSAHSPRGLAANFNAESVIDLAARLENAGKEGNFSEANSLLPQLHHALDHLRETLAACQ